MDPAKKEFADLLKSVGWSQSKAAELLHISPSAVNHLVNPKHGNKPSRRTLHILRTLVDAEKSGRSVLVEDIENNLKKTEQNRVAGVQKRQPFGTAMKYPSDDAGGLMSTGDYVDTMVNQVREIAATDPAKAQELAMIISSYSQIISKKKKKK